MTTLHGETDSSAWWWPCQCTHEHIRHDEEGCANTRTEYNPFTKSPATVVCPCSVFKPAEHPGWWSWDDAQRAHELAQQLNPAHDPSQSSCWCCCEDEGCRALANYQLDGDGD